MEQYAEFKIDGKTIRGILHLPDEGGHRLPAILAREGSRSSGLISAAVVKVMGTMRISQSTNR